MTRSLGVLGMAGALAIAMTAGTVDAAPNTGKVSFSLGTDVTTAYFFRGILQERNGFIAQPWFEVGMNLHEAESAPISSISLVGGVWASAHSKKTGNTGTGAKSLYETDFYAGGNVGILDTLDVGAMYIVYTSPNNAFNAIQEVDFSLALDDSDWLGPLALSPSATFAIEIDETAFGTQSGAYFEFGIEPSFEVIPHDEYPVSLSIPIVAGFSMSDYYEDGRTDDDGWGYGRGGLIFSVPLHFIPEAYGAWAATAGAHIYTFGSNLQQANDNDDPWVVGTWGITMEY